MTERDKLLNEALKAVTTSNYNGIVILPTGSGKSRLMVEVAKLLNPQNILYLCNTTMLRDKMFIDELHKWDAAHLLKRMDLACYQTACKWNNKHYNLLLADEFDAALTPEYIKAITNNQYDYKLLVSATLQEDKLFKAKRIAPIIFQRKLTEVIESNVLNNIQFYFVNYMLNKTENTAYLNYNNRFKSILNGIRTKSTEQSLKWLQIQRKQFLCKLNSGAAVAKWLLNNLDKKDEKVLVFCGLSEQADKICNNTFHSGNNNIEVFNAFDSGKIKHLAVVDKVDRGSNINGIRNIIFESVGSNITKATQRIGRGLRLLPHEFLNVYFLIPHYIDSWGHTKPTIVSTWITSATKEMDLTNVKTIQYK